ncbi:MAG TPA: EAL domain-containing protein [Gammaproteobacteria bacterium]|nr:EAL domain-containing protein [Gammaproteobacteria bacterium]
MTAKEFHKRFLRLIALTWLLPPVVGFSFLLYIRFFTFEQLVPMATSPLMAPFIVVSLVLSLVYFHYYARPLTAYLEQEAVSPDKVEKALRRFALHYWVIFLAYITAAPAMTILSLEMTSGYRAQPVDWFRIHLVALIVSIIVGLPIFVRAYDLFGQAFSGIRLKRPIVTIKMRVFLIGAMIPLLIDTMLVQYYWTRTGFFSMETFFIWLLLECLAVAGALMFVFSFSQSLGPLKRLIESPVESLDSKIQPASTDELGIFAAQLGELLDRQQINQQRLAFGNELLRALHSHENLGQLLQTVVERTCETLNDDLCFLSLYDSSKGKLVCVAQSNAGYRPEGHFEIGLDEASIHVAVYKSGTVQVITNAMQDKRAHKRLRQAYEVQSSAAVPLISNDRVIGVLHVASTTRVHEYTPHELEILQAFASEASVIQVFFEELRQQRKTEAAITRIMMGVSAATGENFFRAIIEHMADVLQADCCAIVTLLPDKPDKLKTLVLYQDGEILPDQEYALKGTPCEDVVGQEVRTFADKLPLQFPDDAFVVEENFQSYVGIPLFDSQRKPLGLMFSMFRRPVENREFNESVMRIFAARTEAEIERTRTEERIKHMAYYDSLTGLPNRAFLQDRLQLAIAGARRTQKRLAVVMMDLDNFKKINDSLGHPVGDAMLIEVAQRLQQCVRREDTVARLGGDEFVILQSGFDSRESAINHITAMAEQLHRSLKEHYRISEHMLMVTCSCGVAIYPEDGEMAETLIKHADTALYKAKASGRDNFQFFSSEMNLAAVERMKLESDIYHGLARDEFYVVYQPKVSIADNRIIGAEALLRWNSPQRGEVPPDSFIPVADETGQILQLGEFVLRQSCELTAELWCSRDCCSELSSLSINVSPRQFQEEDFVEMIQRVLIEGQAKTCCIELEVTENILIEDTQKVSVKLQKLKDIGLKISIDDFGTGYASLRYLQQLPIDMIKIDRSFINNIASSENDRAIVKTVMSMAANLAIDVIAEGVETAEQLALLRDLGCRFYQGYYYCKPVSREEFVDMIRRQRAAGVASG